MVKKGVLSCLSVLLISWLLAARVSGLLDDTGLYLRRNSGSTPLSEGQTIEVHVRDTLPRYLGIIEKVVVKPGDVLGVSNKNQVDGYATKDMADTGIHRMMMVIPAVDYRDLRWMVVEGVQRNDFGHSWDPVRRDKLNPRTVTAEGEYENKLSFYHHEAKDGIVIDLYSGCILPSQSLDLDTPWWSYPPPSLEEMFPNLTTMQAFGDSGDKNPELRP